MRGFGTLVCGLDNQIMRQEYHRDAYVCPDGHIEYGIDLHAPHRCAVYTDKGTFAERVRFLT